MIMLSLKSIQLRLVLEIVLTFIVTLLLGNFAVRYWLEAERYASFSGRIKAAANQIRPGMSRNEVISVVGVRADDIWVNEANDKPILFFYWNAGEHQGCFYDGTAHALTKGHQSLVVTFREDGTVAAVHAGVN